MSRLSPEIIRLPPLFAAPLSAGRLIAVSSVLFVMTAGALLVLGAEARLLFGLVVLFPAVCLGVLMARFSPRSASP